MCSILKQWTLNRNSLALHQDWGNQCHSDNIHILRMPLDGKRLFTGSWDRHLKEWNPTDRTLIHDWGIVHNSDMWHMEIAKDDESMFTVGYDKHLKRWSISQRALIKDFGQIHDMFINRVTISPNMKYVFTGGATEDRSLKIWDMRTSELVTNFPKVHGKCIAAMKATSDNKMLFTGSEDYTVKQFCLKRKRLFFDWGNIHDNWIDCLDLSEDDKL